MAKRRYLKKDINWLTSEVIEDCLLYMDFNPTADEKPVAEIINSIILKRNETIKEINKSTNKQNYKEIKNNYKELIFSFFDSVNDCYDKISKLPRS